MIRLSYLWGSSKTIKTNIYFSKIAKIIFFFFIISLNFYHSQKYHMQILPIERRCYFIKHYLCKYAVHLSKNAGLSPSFFNLHLKTTVVRRANTNWNAHHCFVFSDENLSSRWRDIRLNQRQNCLPMRRISQFGECLWYCKYFLAANIL